jgi:hypothetical protein
MKMGKDNYQKGSSSSSSSSSFKKGDKAKHHHNKNDNKKVSKSLSDVIKKNKPDKGGKGSPKSPQKFNKSNNNNANNSSNDKKRKFKTVHGKRVDDKPSSFKSLKERKPNYGLVESMKDKVNY